MKDFTIREVVYGRFVLAERDAEWLVGLWYVSGWGASYYDLNRLPREVGFIIYSFGWEILGCPKN